VKSIQRLYDSRTKHEGDRIYGLLRRWPFEILQDGDHQHRTGVACAPRRWATHDRFLVTNYDAENKENNTFSIFSQILQKPNRKLLKVDARLISLSLPYKIHRICTNTTGAVGQLRTLRHQIPPADPTVPSNTS